MAEEKEQLEDEIEEIDSGSRKKERLKFTMMLVSMVVIFSVTASLMIVDLRCDDCDFGFGLGGDGDGNCSECDNSTFIICNWEDNGLVVRGMNIWEVCVNERYNERC